MEWTTAGSGIVHGPEHPVEGSFRLQQLWLTLPQRERWTEPDHQLIPRARVPVRADTARSFERYQAGTFRRV